MLPMSSKFDPLSDFFKKKKCNNDFMNDAGTCGQLRFRRHILGHVVMLGHRRGKSLNRFEMNVIKQRRRI